jgi:glutamine amidotransferase
MIVIIDYHMGNLGSILNMLKRIGAPAKVSSETADIMAATKLILPGVGAFDNGMRKLAQADLLPLLQEKVLIQKTPVLGICLGMQLLTRSSEEGSLPGLGWIDGRTVRFKFGPEHSGLKVPHMGWNTVAFRPDSVLARDHETEPRFYFVHSYHVVCNRKEDVAGTTVHGYEFASAVQKDNIFGVQFHPEKSHKFGMQLLKNFVEYA